MSACITWGAPTRAADPSEEARQLFVQGREASRRGELERALALFRKSYQVQQTPGTLLNIADCEERLGMLASAWKHYRELAASLASTDERAVMATSRAAELEARVPWVRLILEGISTPDVRVMVDGVELPKEQLGREIALDPGKHVVTVAAAGRRDRSHALTLPPGGRLELFIGPGEPLAAAAPGQPAPQPPRPVRPEARELPMGDRRRAGLIIGGFGLASMTAGGILGIMALDKQSGLDERCCDGEWLDDQRTHNMLSTLSATCTLLGLAWTGAGVYLALTDPEPHRPVIGVGSRVLAGGAWLGARGSF